jgi:hypothetical protein
LTSLSTFPLPLSMRLDTRPSCALVDARTAPFACLQERNVAVATRHCRQRCGTLASA